MDSIRDEIRYCQYKKGNTTGGAKVSVDNKWIHDYYDERWQHYYDVLTKDIKDIGQVEAMCDRMAMEDVENLEMEG